MKRVAVADESPSSKNRRRIADRVEVDVGGKLFTTSVSTLTGSSAYFRRIFSDSWDSGEGVLFLDRDAEPFAFLLSYMRSGAVELASADSWLCKRIMLEAEYLGIDGLLEAIKATAHRHLHQEWSGTDSEAAAAFDAENGSLEDALASGVLPARFFGPAPVCGVGLLPYFVHVRDSDRGVRHSRGRGRRYNIQ